jgi:hypothetical protein
MFICEIRLNARSLAKWKIQYSLLGFKKRMPYHFLRQRSRSHLISNLELHLGRVPRHTGRDLLIIFNTKELVWGFES